MKHFLDIVLDVVAENRNEPAVSDEFGTFTYGELYDYAICVAANLKARGVRHQGRVIVEITRRKEYAACMLGCWLAGMVAIPLSDDYPEKRLSYIKKDSAYDISIDEDFVSGMDPELKTEPAPFRYEDEGVVIYTSGSTGNPKGVIHDFYSISAVADRNILHEKKDDTAKNRIAGLIAPFTFIVGVSHFISAVACAKHLVIVPDEIRRDPFRLAKYYDDNDIEASYVPPRLVHFMLEHNRSLKMISVGSERITNLYFNDKPVVFNGYGATELFGGLLSFKIDREYENTPIGKPVGIEKAYVLDDNNNEAETGELCIAGYIAKGYLNREKETKKAFIRNPFKSIDGFDRMFRTGDIVQKLPDGNLVFIERKDWMIKINGQRVEPLEVENTIRRIPGIKEITIRDFTAKNGVTYLAAYYVCEDMLTEEQIREYCRANLTSYMVPSFYIRMDKLPLNPNGKLDRIHLPEPDISAFKKEYAAPESKMEEAICKAMEAVLKCGQIGRNDDFFLLGGDSVKAIETINILSDIPLDTETFFEGRTPERIAALVVSGGKNELQFERTEKDAYPLTASQLGVYFAVSETPDTLMYNNPVGICLDENIDAGKLLAAAEKAVNNHKAYRCSIEERNGMPCMVPNDAVFRAERRRTDDMERSLREFVRPFDLKNGETIRAFLFESDTEKVFALDAHHIVFDGTTLSVLLREIERSYAGRDIYEEKTSAFDLSLYEESLRATPGYAEAEAFFTELYDGRELSNDFPCDYEDNGAGRLNVLETGLTLDREKLLAFLKRNGLTENSLFLAAYSYVLAKYNGTGSSVVYAGESGRHTSMTFNTAGMLVKTLALPAELKGEGNIADFIRRLQETFRRSVKNDIYPFSELAGKYGLTNDFSFVYQGDSFTDIGLEGKRYPVTGLSNPDAINRMTLMVFSTGDSYRLSFRYRSDLYSEGVIRAFAEAYACAVREFIEKELLREVELVSESHGKLLDSFCGEAFELEEKTVAEAFTEHVRETPDKDLVVCEGRHYTYGTAGELTDKIARYILDLGLQPNEAVGVLIPRNEWIVLATYGILKAGCAYEPLDATYPSERLTFMVHNAGAKLLITTRELAASVKDYTGETLFIEDIAALPAAPETFRKNQPEDTFVLLYTSGTTGTPKGVQLTQRNAAALVQINRRVIHIDSDTVAACYASYGFDACFGDLASIPACGGTLHVIPEELRLDLLSLDRYCIENRIDHIVMTTQVGRQFALLTRSPYLKCIAVGGEALVPFDATGLPFDFYNLYGPSECTVYVSGIKVAGLTGRIPIGYLNGNAKGYIVDENMNRLPVGAPGELLIAGCQVGKGYLNLPEKTEAVFIDNPFSADPDYKTAYRTGDVVRFLPGGMLDFIGRHDGQVKIRGFRVELPEIEEVIRRFDGIRDATVAAFDDAAGGKYLAAYVVADEKVDTEALNSFIAAEKPPYMVPAVTMQIDAIPLNQNQKVNRRALPKPERKAESIRLPESDMQRTIYDICAKELGHSGFGIDTDLYFAGLTSIGVIRLNVELEKTFDIPFKTADIREHRTVESLEAFILSSRKAEEYDILGDYPLTQTQMGIYIECSADPGTTAYNIPMLMKLSPSLDTERLEAAIRKALDAHPYTKAVLFADQDGNIRARRDDSRGPAVTRVRCAKLPQPEELVKPFSLLGGDLYRIAIYETDDGNFLFMDFHHIASDGMSENVLISDIEKAYAGKAVVKERYTGFEAALDEETARSSERYTAAKEYYDSIFTGCEADCLPAKAPEKDGKGAASLKRTARTSARQVTEYLKKNKFTPNAYFNAAFGYTLSFFRNFEDAVYTTVYNGRSDSRLYNAVTMLVKTLPVLVHTEGSRSVADMIRETQEQLMGSMANDIYSFAEISAAYGIRADIIFAYQGSEFLFDTFCGEKTQLVKAAPDTAKSPITITVYLRDGQYEISAEYLRDRYSEAFISSFIDVFDLVLTGFAEKEKAEEISVISEKSAKTVEAINRTALAFDNISAGRLFERRAKETPEKTAVVASGERLTYKELNGRANWVCGALKKLGVKKDSIVGVLLGRTVDIPVCELAVLKAGGAFLPILPEYPDDRIDFCLRDSESRIVLTTEEIKNSRDALFTEDKPYKAVTVEELLAREAADDPEETPDPDALAYCIYTSGSTGTPKGVMIEHHSLSNFVQTFAVAREMYGRENGGEVGVAFGSISFDIHIIEILLPLCGGKTVVIATENEVHDPAAFTQLLLAEHVDVMACTPSFLMNMLGIECFEKALKGIRSVMVGAEAFPAGLYEKLVSVSPDIYIVNAYGPTECTVSASAKHLTGPENITIGGPAPNYQLYIMDRFSRILPPYAVGELIIAGEGVGRGYVRLPEKNKAVFIDINGTRAYRSGDIARFNGDGEIEFGGRMDNQVKLRGYRVELDEVEKAIEDFEGIRQSKVVVRSNGSEDYLAGFFTASGEIDTDSLNAYLRSRLTYYMVPDILMQLEAMPLTKNGKIDKKALPEVKKQRKKKEKRIPKKSLEQELCELFASVLSLDEYYADDSFFEMGGTSLSASKVTMQLMAKGMNVQYQDIFDNPSPEMLANYIEGMKAPAAEAVKTERDTDIVSDYPELLKYNTLEYAKDVKREPLGDVLLTGAAGFLGIHVLRELLERNEGRIICLLRAGVFSSPEKRLKSMLMYYFDQTFEELIKERVTVLEADITDDCTGILADHHIDTIINCAACVKHYAADDILERINVGGVENMIKTAQAKNARLVQVSTVSIPGVHTEETWRKGIKAAENKLFVIDALGNKYGLSKYHAELKVLEAVKNGMRGKIIRVGNLMGRQKDGEFQINFETNAFLNAVRGFAVIGKSPISHATDPMSFSPVDMTAKAVVLLAGTNDKFTAFNADSRFLIDEWQLIEAANKCGVKITPVPDEEYYADYHRMLGDPKVNERLRGLMTNDRPDIHGVESENKFTANILYRLGFSWPLPDSAYLERALEKLLLLDYFEMDDE